MYITSIGGEGFIYIQHTYIFMMERGPVKKYIFPFKTSQVFKGGDSWKILYTARAHSQYPSVYPHPL